MGERGGRKSGSVGRKPPAAGRTAGSAKRAAPRKRLDDVSERLALAVRSAKVGLWDWDLRTNKVTYSREWKAQLGYEEHEITDDFSEWESRVHPNDLVTAKKTVASFIENPYPDYQNEFRMRHKDGNYRWILAQASLITGRGGKPIRMLGSHVDITGRKRAEARAAQLTRLYATLSQVNQAVVHVQDRQTLFEAVCDAAASYGKFALAWIGILNEDTGDIQPAAARGLDIHNWPFPIVNVREGPSKDGLVATAMRLCQVVTAENLINDGRVQQYRQQLEQFNYQSLAAVPLNVDGATIGVLSLVLPDPGFFSVPEEVRLLEELGGDISFALHSMNREAERARAEDKLRSSEATLRLLIEYTPAGIAMFDRHMRYLAVSQRFLADYRIARDHILGRSHYEVFPEIPERWKEIHRRCLAGETLQADDDPFPRADGTLDWIRWEIRPWYEPSGEVGGIVLFSEVTTEKKQAQAALRESEERFRTAFMTSPDAITITRIEDGKYTSVNQGFTQMLGWDMPDVVGKTSVELHIWPTPDDRQRFMEELKGDGTVRDLEIRLQRKDGRLIWGLVSSTTIVLDDVPYILSVTRDITERRQADKALRESEERFRQAFEGSPDAISISRADDGVYVSVNLGATEMFGYAPEELIGKTAAELGLWPDPEGRQRAMQLIQRDGVLRNFEAQARRKNGEILDVLLSSVPIAMSGGPHLLATVRDISELKKAERALRESEEKFRKALVTSPDAITLASIDTWEYSLVNEGFTRMLGYTAQEVLGESSRGLEFWEDPNARVQLVETVLRDGSVNDFQTRLRRKDGELIDVSIASNVITLGGIQQSLNITRDITERKRAAMALADSEQKFRALFEKAPFAAGLARLGDGVLVDANKAAESLLGYPRDELLGKRPHELGLDPAVMQKAIADLTAGRPVHAMEVTGITRSGQVRDLLLNMALVTIGGEEYVMRMAQDITDRKLAEKRIEKQVRHLSALRDIDTAISSSMDLRITLDVLLEHALSLLHVDAADVLLLNETTGELAFAAGRGFRTSGLSQLRVRLGQDYAGRAIMERQIMSTHDLQRNPRALARGAEFDAEGFWGYHAAPLTAKGKVRGVLEVFRRSPVEHEDDWLDLFQTLAEQSSLAISDAELFSGLQKSQMELVVAYRETIEGWSRALDLRDKETEGHTQRVTDLTLRLAQAMGIGEEELMQIRHGALLHDIGKMGVPDAILLKPGPLTVEEWESMRKHPEFAYRLIAPISYLRQATDIPYCHHEKWDGTGYPRQLAGEQIPLAARIFSVVDVWDALRSDRPYRAAWTEEKVREHLRAESGKSFDPRVVEVFLRMGPESQ